MARPSEQPATVAWNRRGWRYEKYRPEVELGNISHVVQPGHALQPLSTSSDLPCWDRNTNTGERPATAVRKQRATQTVYHDVERPSRLLLPVVRS